MEKQGRKPLRHISRVTWEGGQNLVFEFLASTEDRPLKLNVPLAYAADFDKLMYYLGDNGHQADRRELKVAWDNLRYTIRAEHGRASA